MRIYLVCLPQSPNEHSRWVSYGDASFVAGDLHEAVIFTDEQTAAGIAKRFSGEVVPFEQQAYKGKVLPFKEAHDED